MNNSDIRLAVVGFGDIAKKHLAAFRALGVNVVAAANRSLEGRRKAEQEGGIERTYSDALTMMERERPDGVLVSASVLSQFEVVRNLIPYDVPLLVEKPPAVSFQDWNSLRVRDRGATPTSDGGTEPTVLFGLSTRTAAHGRS